MRKREAMTAEQILELDTEAMSLQEMVAKLDHSITKDPMAFGEAVYLLRRQHEIDTGIPMEEDYFGEQEAELKRFGCTRMSQRIDEDDLSGNDAEADDEPSADNDGGNGEHEED